MAWGALHGLALIGHREWTARTQAWNKAKESTAWRVAATVLTFYFVSACLIFFRAADLSKPMSGEDFARAIHITRAFSGLGFLSETGGLKELDLRLFAVIAGLAFVHWLNFKRVFSTWWRSCPEPLFATAYGCMTAVILLFIPAKYAPFIYFQF